jgi:hypothetical protein
MKIRVTLCQRGGGLSIARGVWLFRAWEIQQTQSVPTLHAITTILISTTTTTTTIAIAVITSATCWPLTLEERI